jgi:hypothetical protein
MYLHVDGFHRNQNQLTKTADVKPQGQPAANMAQISNKHAFNNVSTSNSKLCS